MKKLIVILSLLFLVGCDNSPAVEPNAIDPNEELLLLFDEEPLFEDRDPNEELLTFTLKENDVNMVVELDIDPNGCLYIRTENCKDMKETARVVWKCCRIFWGK